jgi:hypothetical protein
VDVHEQVVSASCSRREGSLRELRRVHCKWPAPGSEDTELGVILEPEVVYGTQTLCTRVQA